MAHLHDLLGQDSNITISMTGVDYNDDYDHKDYDTMPSLLVFEPQEFSRPLSNAIAIFGADDKAKSVCG